MHPERGLFYKQIDNPIFTRTQEFEDFDFEGRHFAELQISRPENADDGEVLGVELNYQQQFVSLPSPWNGFGLGLNYTWTDSETNTFDREDELPFFLQSDDIGNAALFFERSGFEARLAYAYRSEYLEEVGGDPDEDLYIDARGQLDFKTSYALEMGVKVFLEVLNITDEPLRFISGRDTGRLAENEIYSWNAVMGLQFEY